MDAFVDCLRILLACFQGQQRPPRPPQQQQQQQGQYHQQYPPPQGPFQPYEQQQQAYPQQQQPSWSQVAGQQHYPQQQPYRPQQQQQQQNGQYPGAHHAPNGGVQGQWDGWQRPPGLPAGGVVGPHHAGYQNQDQVNATNEKYQQLRNQARHEGDEAHRCFAQSQAAYQSGDGARAHELSQEGKQHAQTQDRLDDEASAWIFNENNSASPPGTVDLHGLYVKEAIEHTEQAINSARAAGQPELRVIVGKGIHSQGHVAKIKPAVEDLMRKYDLAAHLDPHNAGVLVVDLTGGAGGGGGGRSRDAGGLVDDLQKQDEGCRVM